MAAMRMTFTVEDISPQRAAQLLERNVYYNRRVRVGWVRQLAKAMATGGWHTTHQGIALSPEGELLDGQHRLMAVALANVTVPLVVARNVPVAGFPAFDRGQRRSIADNAREDRRLVEVAHLLAIVGNNYNTTTLTDLYVLRVLEAFRPEITAVTLARMGMVKHRTATPIRAAAALTIAAGHDMQGIGSLYQSFVRLDAGLPPALMALQRQLESGQAITTKRYDLLARALIAFDPLRAGVSKLQVKDVTAALAPVVAIIRDRAAP